MNVSGKIVEIFEIQQVTDSFKKREFVIEYAENPKYSEFIKFELIQDKCSEMDECSVGDEINVEFNLRGRKWTDPKGQTKYFNSLQAWKVGTTPKSAPENPPTSTEEPDWLSTESNDGDLPF